MKKFSLSLLLCGILSLLFSFEPHFMVDPAVSPDGTQICFVFMNDLWIVPFEGGTARRLTSTDSSENSPVFSPDGKLIAFNSNRDGQNKIYTISPNGGLAQKIGNRNYELCDWFPDGKSLLAIGSDASTEEPYFRIDLQNPNKPNALSGLSGMFSAVSPDGKTILFNKGGDAYRESYTGSHNGDLYIYDIASKKFSRLTNTDYSERYPVYSVKNKNTIYYCGSDSKVFQIYKSNINTPEKKECLTSFDTWSARDISIARQNDRMSFEFFDCIYTLDPETKKTQKLNIDIAEDCLSDFTVQETNRNRAKNFAVSPNGKLIVYSYMYDLFAVPTAGGEVKQLTKNQPGIEEIVIANDNTTIFYSAYLKGNPVLYKLNINNPDKIELVDWSKDKRIESIYFNNDKKLYIRYSEKDDRNRIAVMDTTWSSVKTLIGDRYVSSGLVTSENKKFGVFIENTSKAYTDILNLYDFEKKTITPLYSYNGWISSPIFSFNDESVFFVRSGNIVRMDLAPRNEFSNEKDNWADILKKEKTKKNNNPKSEYDFTNVENRISALVTKSGWSYPVYSTKDSILYYMNINEGKNSLRKVKFDGSEDKEVMQINSDNNGLSLTEDNKTVFYISGSNLYSCGVGSKNAEMLTFKHQYEYNTVLLNKSVFEQVWASFGNNFYDSKMHNKDWNEMFDRFSKYSQYMLNTDILSSVVNELIGELNASHTGFYPRSESRYRFKSSALLGLEYDYSKPLAQGVLVKKAYRNSSLADVWKIKPGDIIYSVNGITIDENNPLEFLLLDKVNETLKINFKRNNELIETTVKGLDYRQHSKLRYDNWVEERRQIVAKASNNQIGYLHIEGMNRTCLEKFKQDLFAKNFDTKALIIDIRENGGGNIHDELIEILTKKQYAFSSNRYFGAEKNIFPASVYDKPIVLLINENSFSDAEIFPILFDYFKLGIIIGMPTSGSVIGTGSVDFMDGSSMRMPSNGWYTMKGINMEGTGAKPHILVPHTLNDVVIDNDLQLSTAVSELLKKIK